MGAAGGVGVLGAVMGTSGVSGGVGVSGYIGGGKWAGSLTTLGHSPGSQYFHWFPWGIDYLARAKQVTEMSSAGYHIHLELYFVTVFTFVSMPPHHIFLNAI